MSELDLELQPGACERKRKKKAPKPPTVSVRLETLFQSAYQERWGHPYLVKPGRDRKILNDLVATWGEEIVADLIDFFFKTTDPEVKRSRSYNVPDFLYWAPKLRRLRDGRGALSAKTARNVDEISKAMGVTRNG